MKASIRVAKMRFEQKGIELKLIVVDHMHKMRSRSPGKMIEQMTEISRGLAEMPKRFNACVLALAQLNRSLESRDDKRPMLSDLRESGSLEQDADSVIFCYRAVYYLEREGKRNKMDAEADRQADISAMKNTMEVIVAKQRQGPIGSVKLFADMPANKIMDMSEAMAGDENHSEENSLQF